MAGYRMEAINDSKLKDAKLKMEKKIDWYRRSADAARRIAENFNGAYITKRMEDKILAILPGAKRVWFYQANYTDHVSVHISFSDHYDREEISEIVLCRKDNRRLDAAKLIEYAKSEELNAMNCENLLGRIDCIVEKYEAIAKQYAEIEDDLNDFFSYSLPTCDSVYERIAKSETTPEKFLESIPA